MKDIEVGFFAQGLVEEGRDIAAAVSEFLNERYDGNITAIHLAGAETESGTSFN
jgi:hypothetical protein